MAGPERPDDRRSRMVWWATVAVMVVIAVVILLIAKPWVIKPGASHHKARTTQSTAN